MNAFVKCLQIVEDNTNNPRTFLWSLTMCLQHWDIRIQTYSKMGIVRTDNERRLIHRNHWGEDDTIKELIEIDETAQPILDLWKKNYEIEQDMENRKKFDRTHEVIPLLSQLHALLLPYWIKEINHLKINKEQLKVKEVMAFALNVRDYDNPARLKYSLNLLNKYL